MPPKKTTRKEFSQQTKQTAWNSAPKIRGKNPDIYRRTADGQIAHKTLDGKQINYHYDHKNSCQNGGTNSVRNC